VAADWPLSGHPLRGVRVVELTHVAAGPFAGMLLADLGADVVKLEPPTGDQMRSWPPIAEDPETGEQFSHNFASVNRNKRSVVVDLKDTGDTGDLARARALVAEAGVMRAMGTEMANRSGLFPQVNAEIQGDEIVLKHYYDIGIAVGAEGGLVVPVLRDADRMSFADIEGGVRDFAKRAGDGTLTLDDLSGGTFTITNPGVFGGLFGTPIINQPQLAILGVGKIEKRAKVMTTPDGDDFIGIRWMAYFALSFDHRVIDGADAERFLAFVKEQLEAGDFSV